MEAYQPTEAETERAIGESSGLSKLINNGTVQVNNYDPGSAPGRAQDKQFKARLESMKQRHRATGTIPATIVNFLPYKLMVSSPDTCFTRGVPPATGDKPYATRTWTEPFIIAYNRGEQGREPFDIHPLQIAEAFVHENPRGGVVVLPCTEKEVGDPKYKDLLDREAQRAVALMEEFVSKGEFSYNETGYVDNVQKACAQRLFDLKIMAQLPNWKPVSRKLHEVPVTCGSCGKTADSKFTVRCANCNYVIDPAKAYLDGIIGEDHESLERLTRAEVAKLGISDYVAETVDEKKERIKQGLQKPMSVAAHRALQAAEDAEEEAEKKAARKRKPQGAGGE